MNLNLNLDKWQLEFLQSEKLILALSGASNSGKSWVCRLKLILHYLQTPSSNCFVTASTHTQTKRAIIEPMIQFLSENKIEYVAKFNKGEGYLQFTNNSRIEIFSSDNMNFRLRSREFSIGFVEEASTIPETQIEQIINESIRRLRPPAPGPYHLLIATNPGLKSSWIYNNIFGPSVPTDIFTKHLTFREGFNKNDKDYESKLLRASKRDQDIFYNARWGSLEGQAFELEVGRHIKPLDFSDFDRFFISFDYGFSPDFMVYQLFSIKNSVVYLVDELVFNNTPISRHTALLEPWCSNYNVIGFTGETSVGSGEVRNMMFESFKLKYYKTTKDRTLGWTKLADMLETNNLIINSKCKKTIESLESLKWIGGTRGIDTQGSFEDPSDALRYFIMSSFMNSPIKSDKKLITPQKINLTLDRERYRF